MKCFLCTAEDPLSIKDIFRKTILESFSYGQSLTGEAVSRIIISLIFALLIGLLIYWIYKTFFGGVVFSRSLAVTLVGMTVLSCTITLAISTNIVISLGMVGALSIVRYRTAVKEPMDLLYLFWSISMGITIGAGMYALAVIASIAMIIVIWLLYVKQKNGMVYIMVVHYKDDRIGDEIVRSMGRLKYRLKAKTFRGNRAEMTMEVYCKKQDTSFIERIRDLGGVEDVSLIEYNGEYHG